MRPCVEKRKKQLLFGLWSDRHTVDSGATLYLQRDQFVLVIACLHKQRQPPFFCYPNGVELAVLFFFGEFTRVECAQTHGFLLLPDVGNSGFGSGCGGWRAAKLRFDGFRAHIAFTLFQTKVFVWRGWCVNVCTGRKCAL